MDELVDYFKYGYRFNDILSTFFLFFLKFLKCIYHIETILKISYSISFSTRFIF